jgi:proteasome lid subunit RPN8/RPN11
LTLHLLECARDSITQHGEGGFPNEICGILLGKDVDGKRTIRTVLPISNSFQDDEQYHRYLIRPDDVLKAERLARYDGLDVLGVYHSHPNAPAQPSEYDREYAAWSTWSYIILSVRDGKGTELRAWKLRDDRSAFDEEAVTIEP